ncbi:MAG: hypothetical protein P1V36_10090 [Planctomycetota bacterium]|nr:hypothetical protein [Planctomycetota bacterium]
MTSDRDMDPDAPAAPVRQKGLIQRDLIDEHALFVVKRLQREGHEAYLVGGCVQDLLGGLEPKDFDVATDARPNRVKRLFRSARVIGRRFRLVHIRFPGDLIIETATFRGDPTKQPEPDPELAAERGRGGRRGDWRTSVENVFGTADEDARRRDFTVNALFYDPVADEVIDWVGGLADSDEGLIRSIGEPAVRIEEDPVRMLRAVHYAQRMDFAMEPALETAIEREAERLADASQARLYIELVKMLSRGRGRGTFHKLHELGVLPVWLPELTEALDEPATWPEAGGGTHEEASQGEPVDIPIGHATWNLLGAADKWGLAAHRAPESLTLAVLFGPWLLRTWRGHGFHAFVDHLEATFRPVALRMSIPRWASTQMRDVLWLLSDLREPPPPKKARRLLQRPAFPVALAFLELDLMARDASLDTLEHWRELADEAGRDLSLTKPERQPRPRRGGRGPRGGEGGNREPRSRGRRRGGRGRARRASGPPAPEAAAWDDPPDA